MLYKKVPATFYLLHFLPAQFFFVLLLVLLSFKILAADIVYLKNGRCIEGLVKSEDEERLELEVSSGAVKFDQAEIERIEKSTTEKSLAIRQNWAKEKLATQEKIQKQQQEEARKPKGIGFSSEDQGIMLSVVLNKKIEASLLLDTGASIIILRKDMAEKLGIDLSNLKADAKLTLADGREVEAKYIVLESVQAQGVEVNDVAAAILLDEVKDARFKDGLLGMSFLKRFNFQVDHRENKLILEKI